MVTLLAASLLLQSAPAPAQSEADKLEAALKKFGDRKYRLFTMGKETGHLSMKTRIETEGDQKVAVFEDKGDVKIEDKVEGGTMTERLALVGPRILSITSKDAGGRNEVAISIREGKATIKKGEDTKVLNVTNSSIGMGSVYRMVCTQEQKVGGTFKIDHLGPEGFSTGHEFRCVGREQLEIAGVKHNAFKWELKGEGDIEMPGVENSTYSFDNAYWVSPDGYLLRMAAFDEGKIVNEMILDAK